MIRVAVVSPDPAWREAHWALDDEERWGDEAFGIWSMTGAARRPHWPGLDVGWIGIPDDSPILQILALGGTAMVMATARLSVGEERAYRLIDLEGASIREAASMLGVAKRTVEVQVARARTKLASLAA